MGNFAVNDDEPRPGDVPGQTQDGLVLAPVADMPQLAPSAPPPFLHTIFAGPQGLRAGWSLLIYLVMGLCIALVLIWVTKGYQPHGAARLWMMALSEAELLAAALIPAVIMGKIEKRPVGVYGLPRRSAFGRLFWVGVAWGMVWLTLLMLAMRGLHAFYFGHLTLHGERIVKFAAFWGLFFLIVGFFEEFLLRGYSQYTLTRGIGFWPAAILLSAIFGGIHLGNEGEAWIGALAAALIGLFFCLTLRRTGNLWFAVGFHASWDWGETYLYSVPNSGTTAPGHLLGSSFHGSRWLTGGSVGPEGSLLVFVIIVTLWLAFSKLYPQVRYGGKILETTEPLPPDNVPSR